MQTNKDMIKCEPIATEKITRNCWIAKTKFSMPNSSRPNLSMDVEQKGSSEQDAIDKLKKFLGDNIG